MEKKSNAKTSKAGGRVSSRTVSETRRVVLVGTYKGGQLTKWRGWYNYPISDDDKITEVDAASITELWLFKGTRERKTYKAEFVGIKTRDELIRDYGYLSWEGRTRLKLRIKTPPRLNKDEFLTAIKFDPSWIEIVE